MKLRITSRPWIIGLLLATSAVLCWGAGLALEWPIGLPLLLIAAGHTVLFTLSLWALWRISVLERWTRWENPERLLVLAPHEDDCAIAAGGIGERNQRLGGATRIVYLAPDEVPGMSETRAIEARNAWRQAGLGKADLQHLDLLPLLHRRDPRKLHDAARTLRGIVEDFQPTVVVVPMFEGGHVHHDQIAGLLDQIVTPTDRFRVFEAPEYSPYVSLRYTPHRVIALCARWLYGLVVYHGPPDGIDARPIEKVRLEPADLAAKQRMLSAFVSQNAPVLAATRAYPDRLVRWQPIPGRRQPFGFRWSYLNANLAARRLLPARIVDALLPVQRGTIGREGRLTDWREEWSLDD